MGYALRRMMQEPVQWNPTADLQPSLHWYEEGFKEMHSAVRATNYLEVSSLLGTCGCSKDAYGWTWSVMGIIETDHGKLVVAPNNWIFEPVEGVFVVLTDAEFQAMFTKTFYQDRLNEADT